MNIVVGMLITHRARHPLGNAYTPGEIALMDRMLVGICRRERRYDTTSN